MKQLKFISILFIIFAVFNLTETSAQNWRLSLTTDFHVPLDNKIDYWDEAFGDEYGSLRSRKKQKSSVSLLADYHFFSKKPIGFFVGTGIGHRKHETFERSRASGPGPYWSAHVFSLYNVTVPWRIGLDVRPNDKLTINASATFEHMFPAAGGDRIGTSISGEELSNDEYILGEISDDVYKIGYTLQNQGGGIVSLALEFDIEIYKNYHLLIGTGIGSSFNEYITSYSIYHFSPITGEPESHADASRFAATPESYTYNFINLKAGITKTF